MKKIDLAGLKEDRKTLALVGIIVSTFVVLDLVAVIRPQVRALSKLNSRVRRLKLDIINARKDIAALKEYKANITAQKKRSGELTQRIVAEEDISALLEEISKIAGETNLKILQIKPVKNERKEALVKTPLLKIFDLKIEISANAGFHELGRFINRIENSDIFMKVESLSINHRRDDYLHHDIGITLLAYFIGK